MTHKNMRWRVREAAPGPEEQLAGALGVTPLVARWLVVRGLADPEAANRFLHPDLTHLHPPLLMRGMDAAVKRIFQALDRKEKILIYGDYDVDGALAVVLLDSALRLLGADTAHFIPHRLRDGYGMREEVIEQARSGGTRLVISVDTGIRSFGVVERARELGLDCIITDHHLPAASKSDVAEVPRAVAVLNPRQPGCSYPDKNLCGAGVAFKLVQALLEAHPVESARVARLLPSYLKLVCIGTIADSVPLTGENRVIARLGLEGLRTPAHPGLKALLEVAGLDQKAITAWDVGFRIAPRLNAAGRMDSAQHVIELFTLADPVQAQQLAQKLNHLNLERQSAEQKILSEIEQRYRQSPECFAADCLVVEGEGWHRGVIGIVASRLVERFRRPALVISCEDGSGYGSGRSSGKFHLLEALTRCEDLFDRYGGHRQAVGFALPVERIPDLRRRLNEYAARHFCQEDRVPELEVDAEISLADLPPNWLPELEQLAPHGCGNPPPLFLLRNAQLAAPPRMIQEKHLKLKVAQQGRVLEAMGWRLGHRIGELGGANLPLDLVLQLAWNHYRGQTVAQWELLDFRDRGQS
ncbi:MAG: single-stranded-DNA-specific exonuclease RecJ [Acidobacteria bacterium]|nr:single-stranded-DNA-specific exonuclease RecJ [Acidobacteriota bacterium]